MRGSDADGGLRSWLCDLHLALRQTDGHTHEAGGGWGLAGSGVADVAVGILLALCSLAY